MMINKFIKWGFVLFLCLQWKVQALSQITIKVDASFKNETIIVSFRDSSYIAQIDEKGIARIVVDKAQNNGYAVFYAPRSVHNFYVIPDSAQSISLLPEIAFEGAGKSINDYLNNNFIHSLRLPYEKNEDLFIKEWRNLLGKLQKHLESYSFPKSFTDIEYKRIYYQSCNILLSYPLYHSRFAKKENYTPHDYFYIELQKCLKEDFVADEIWEYRQFYRDWLDMSAERISANKDAIDKLKWKLDYIEMHIKDAVLRDYLVHDAMTSHLRYVGAEKIDEFIPYYKNNVQKDSHKHEFYSMYNKYIQLLPKELAPQFTLPDIKGNDVSLSQFLGNYVYIDVWASWCRPCCREFPMLEKLEKHFEGKPIRFISVSIDKDEETWKKKVEKENFKGILLYAGPESSFRKDYKINLIPHFILLDKEGRFINARMTRPSDTETYKTLENLLNH